MSIYKTAIVDDPVVSESICVCSQCGHTEVVKDDEEKMCPKCNVKLTFVSNSTK